MARGISAESPRENGTEQILETYQFENVVVGSKRWRRGEQVAHV